MSPPRRQRGFILVAAIGALAGLAMLAGYVATVVTADRERAEQARQALQDELDARGTLATLAYLLSTSRMSQHGLILEEEQQLAAFGEDREWKPGDGELEVSGTVYAGLGRTRFFLQDETALPSVNRPDPMLVATFRHIGVADEEIEWLMPRILDYVDLDDLMLLNGAERVDYQRAAAPPPANWFLATPLELKNVLGVDELLGPRQWRQLRRLVTARLKTNYNINTMSRDALTVLLNGDENAVRQLVALRAKRPVRDVRDLRALTGQPVALGEDMLMLPSRIFRIALWAADDRTRTVVGITLTPSSTLGPWRKEYSHTEPVEDDAPPPLAAATSLFPAA